MFWSRVTSPRPLPSTVRVEAEAASLEAMQYYHTVRSAFGSRGASRFMVNRETESVKPSKMDI